MGCSFSSLLGWSHFIVPRMVLEFEFRVQAFLLLVCLQAWLGGESPADAGGIRREGYLLLTLRLVTEYVRVLSFREGREASCEEKRQIRR